MSEMLLNMLITLLWLEVMASYATPLWETNTGNMVNDQWASFSFWFPPNENGRIPKMCTHGGFSLPTECVAVDGRVPFISWQFSEMNQTTWPPRDPRVEQGNKCFLLKTRTFPRALAHRDNVMAEFPFRLFQTGNETRSFLDLTLCAPLLAFQTWGKWNELYKTFSRVLFL